MRVKTVCCLTGWVLSVIVLGVPVAAEVRIKASPVKQDASLDPFDPIWERVPGIRVPLMAQELFTPRGGGTTSELLVQTLFTSTHLYLRLQWADSTSSGAQDVHRTEAFDDAVAVQFPLHPQDGYPSPFMGDPQHPVSIWHWKASWEKTVVSGQWSVVSERRETVADDYPFDEEATFRTGEAVGNLFSVAKRSNSVEHLIASGFGTLTTTKTQPVEGRGVWRDVRWSVVMRRALVPQDSAVEVDVRDLSSIPIAFAVWDGAHQERDGMKSVSVWQTLVFERPIPWWKRFGQWASKVFQRPPTSPSKVTQAASIGQGKRVYAQYGCASCHGSEGRGGIRNPNALSGQEVPPLIHVAAAFTKEELKEKIRQGSMPARMDPKGTGPERVMPGWHPVMNDEELEALAAYLMGLAPEDTELW